MLHWIKRLHIYAGLLNFTIVMVFGIAGLTATISPERPQAGPVEMRAWQPPANLSDYDTALAACDSLRLPLSPKPPRGAVRRDAQNHVVFSVYTVNGPRVITLLEKEGQIQIDPRKNRLWHFFNNLHATLPREASTDLRLRLWAWYVEFAIWSLLFMSASGVYLWLASRPGYRWAQISFAAGTGVFLVLYGLTR